MAIATVAISCQKVQPGGNKDVLKLEEGTERYSDDKQVGEIKAVPNEVSAEHAETNASEAPKTDSTATPKAAPAEAPKAEH